MKKILDEKFEKGLSDAIEKLAEVNAEFADFLKKDANETLAKENGSFKFVISDETKDRAGEVIKVSGWDLTKFESNPVVLFAHDYYSMPVGKATKTYVEGKKLVSEGIFAPTEQAQMLRKLYEQGFIKTTSVGFIVKERDAKDDSVITKAELLEFSLVPVPANPNALALAQEKGIAMDELFAMATKGLFTEEVKTRDVEQGEDEPEPTAEQLEDIENGTEPKEDEEGTEDTEVTPEETEKAQKGAIEDEINRPTKWKNFSKVDAVIMAFWKVYFTEGTPIEDFEKLLAEAIEMLQKVHDGVSVKELGIGEVDSKTLREGMEGMAELRTFANDFRSFFGVEKDTFEEDVKGAGEDAVKFERVVRRFQSIAGELSLALRDAKEVRNSTK